ncbi:MAG: DUF2087 domain-containing protein [Specibacter sp.]
MNAWQPVVAALANDHVLRTYAGRVLGVAGPAADKDLRRLVAVGLLAPETYAPIPGAFGAVLAANAVPTREGTEKFFEAGMLTGLPAHPDARREVLEHLAGRLVPDTEVLTERDINLVLATVTRDVPALRRALVDHGLLVRTADGAEYRRP